MAERTTGRAVLLSVKPRFAYAILGGAKHVELRRVQPAEEVSQVVLYATAPKQRIVGWFDVKGVEVASPAKLWRRFGAVSSLTHAEFDLYFEGCSQGVAIRVGEITELSSPVPLGALGNMRPPQSFAYLADEAFDALRVFEKAALAR